MQSTSNDGGLRAGVIGLGVGRQHADAFFADERCRLVAVCDRSPERLEEAAGAWEGVRTLTDADELIADPEVDVVAIASFDDDHYPQARAALAAGKHVFCEKPLCRTLDEARSLLEAWESGGRPYLASNLVLRAAPLYGWLRSEVAAGRLGDVYAFDGDYVYGRLHKITEGWRGQIPDYSVMLGGGVHLVDLMLWITGERPVAVTAVGNGIVTAESSFNREDFVAATFELPSGAIGRITANFGAVHRHQHVVRVFGSLGTVVHDDCGPRLHRERDGGAPAEAIDLDPLPAGKADLVGSAIEAILSDAPTEELARHDLAVVAACSAADRSLREGARIVIDYA